MRGAKVKALNRIFRRFPPVPDSDSKRRFVGSALGGAIPLTARAFRRELRHNRQVQDAAMSVALVPPVFSRMRLAREGS